MKFVDHGVVEDANAQATPASDNAHIPSITSLKATKAQELMQRKKRYLTLMSFRVPALLAATLIYLQLHIVWLSLLIIGLSIPLPWIAVLIANDRPAKRTSLASKVLGFSSPEKYWRDKRLETLLQSAHSAQPHGHQEQAVVIDVPTLKEEKS